MRGFFVRRWAVMCIALMMLVVAGLPAAAQPAAEEFDLGDSVITQAVFPAESRFSSMSVPLRGLVAVPEGEGPFPVAIIVHGSYSFCTAPLINHADQWPCPDEYDLRQYRGFSDLAGALAARGYLTIVPDLAAEYTNGWGEAVFGERTSQMLMQIVERLGTGEGFPADVAGKANTSQILMAGHSRGAPQALYFSEQRVAAGLPPVEALAMITPAAWHNAIPDNMPEALITGTCAGDLAPRDSEFWIEQLEPLRPSLTVLETLEGFTHNAISTALRGDPFQICAPEDIVAVETQRAWLSEFIPGFFDLVQTTSPHR